MPLLLIADDHPLYRDALKGALSGSMADIEWKEADSLGDALEIIQHNDIDLLLLDLHMPGSSDLFGLFHVRKLFPDLPVAVVSGLDDSGIVSKVINAGAMGFIPKTVSSSVITKAIQTILDGDIWVPESYLQDVNQQDHEFASLAEKVSSLTPAQYKVLYYMRDGLLNKQIGFELDIAEATVKAHVTALFRKLNINNRTQAVLIASQLQLVPPAASTCHQA